MKRIILIATFCLCCLAATAGSISQSAATKPADKLVFQNNGFSISPLDEAGEGTYQVLMMFLRPSKDFAPNVNVMRQAYGGTLDQYAALSRKQFENLKFKVLSESRPDKHTVVFEYAGQMQGRTLHWYARVVLQGGTAFLVTATAAEDHWKDVSVKLKSCVDSFERARRREDTRRD